MLKQHYFLKQYRECTSGDVIFKSIQTTICQCDPLKCIEYE